MISAYYRIIQTICEHIVTNEVLPSRGVLIRIDEPADFGIIISALQVVQAKLLDDTLAKQAKTGCF